MPGCAVSGAAIGPRTSRRGRAARARAGIGSVSLDLLYDAPDASLADWIETLEAALALDPTTCRSTRSPSTTPTRRG